MLRRLRRSAWSAMIRLSVYSLKVNVVSNFTNVDLSLTFLTAESDVQKQPELLIIVVVHRHSHWRSVSQSYIRWLY